MVLKDELGHIKFSSLFEKIMIHESGSSSPYIIWDFTKELQEKNLHKVSTKVGQSIPLRLYFRFEIVPNALNLKM